jgi:hypothetical protein
MHRFSTCLSLQASEHPSPNPFTLPSLSRLKQRHSRNRADAHQDRNIILSQTFEYRLPAPPKPIAGGEEKVTMDMTSRYMGLVVVPGEYIERIEVEEFESQMKGKGVAMAGEKGEEEV